MVIPASDNGHNAFDSIIEVMQCGFSDSLICRPSSVEWIQGRKRVDNGARYSEDMHVIAGRFKGVALEAAKAGTRPTTDRTKEAIFSRLDAWGVLRDARILDLYAGTGALGIEAMSRGGQELVSVESAAPMTAAIAKTLTSLKRHSAWSNDMRAVAVRGKAERYVERYSGSAFDVVFIDPPYAVSTEDCEELLGNMVGAHMLDPDALIVLERSARSEQPVPPEGWQISERRVYGETAVYYIESLPSQQGDE
ncbi:putative rRNA (guanine-N(2)-)-methyltransferase [Bifidobacterium tsurumiense]|uniref:Putative rRNA (Guanine-N(2)-)-methyltransferase n=2 Tax=Bifidobacterium tsurumiense TaxID=356829 RepID=A0A087EKC5_9BIFI|nr:putative rRNA (guanine-N(2)-)-methyltransferase [Bifidobacterium tsurumiense]